MSISMRFQCLPRWQDERKRIWQSCSVQFGKSWIYHFLAAHCIVFLYCKSLYKLVMLETVLWKKVRSLQVRPLCTGIQTDEKQQPLYGHLQTVRKSFVRTLWLRLYG